MSYTILPNSGQSLGGTRDQIRTNFSLIKSVFDVNHFTFGEGGDGKHRFVSLPNFSISSIPPTAANEGQFYVKLANGRSQLFYTNETSGNEYQLTRTNNTDFPTFSTNTNYSGSLFGGWTFLPGGMLLQYGFTGTLSSGNNVILFPKTFTNVPYSITTTMIRDSGNVDVVYVRSVATVTTSQFQIHNTSSGNSAYWMAIGV